MNPKHLLAPKNAAQLLHEPWGFVSLTLNEIGQSEKWLTTHSSFTAWVKSFAEAATVQESSLWRMIAAGRFYSSLGTKVGALKLPGLVEISKTVTAEQLELVEKIGRVSSPTETEKLLAGVINGSLTRDKLRTRWRIYRDAASTKFSTANMGANTRNRVVLPKMRGVRVTLYDSSVEQLLVTLIEKQPVKDWIGNSNPYFIKTFYRPPIALSGTDKSGNLFRFLPDILVVIQEFEEAPVLFHIVEVVSNWRIDSLGALMKVDVAKMYADYFWFAVGDFADDNLLQSIPAGVGLITFSHAGIAVRQQAIAVSNNFRSGDLAKLLLTKV